MTSLSSSSSKHITDKSHRKRSRTPEENNTNINTNEEDERNAVFMSRIPLDIVQRNMLSFLPDTAQLDYASRYNRIHHKHFVPHTLNKFYSYNHLFPNNDDARKAINSVIIKFGSDANQIKDLQNTNIKSISYELNAPLPESICTRQLERLQIFENIDISNIARCERLHHFDIGWSIDYNSERYRKYIPGTFDLVINEEFSNSIEALGQCHNLKIFHSRRNLTTSLIPLERCVNLEDIKFEKCSQTINFIKKLPKIQKLYLGRYFNHSIDNLKYCPNLKSLHLGNDFNQPIDILIHCTKLEEVMFGYNFEQDVSPLSKCEQLKLIILPLGYKDLMNIHPTATIEFSNFIGE
jgi:hypothetical protein